LKQPLGRVTGAEMGAEDGGDIGIGIGSRVGIGAGERELGRGDNGIGRLI